MGDNQNLVLYESNETEYRSKMKMAYLAASVCSIVFYQFMIQLDPNNIDFIQGRWFVFCLGILYFGISTFVRVSKTFYHLTFMSLAIAYIFLYAYLLELNQWSVFHRWSYFVVAAILCGIVLSWMQYLIVAAFALFVPLVAGFWSPLSGLALVHFHVTNITVFTVIGWSVRLHFHYKEKTMELALNMIEKSKMVALGEMSGGVSHEVNTPLHAINSSIHILKRNYEQGITDQDKVFKEIKRISKMTQRIETIVNGLSDFAKSDVKDELTVCKIEDIVGALKIKWVDQKINSAAKIDFEKDNLGSELVVIQKEQVTQAIWNLLENALYSTRDQVNASVKLKISHVDDFFNFDVYDSGPGVKEEILDKIMQPFFTTKEVGEGPGLGLSVALGIARRHSGNLTYVKEKSEFYFRFMISNRPALYKNQNIKVNLSDVS